MTNMPQAQAHEMPIDEILDKVLERSELIQSGVFRTARFIPSENNPVISSNTDLDIYELQYKQDWGNLALVNSTQTNIKCGINGDSIHENILSQHGRHVKNNVQFFLQQAITGLAVRCQKPDDVLPRKKGIPETCRLWVKKMGGGVCA